ncbi:hypothetical protein NDU88_006746 [Pleurodeles waltl]|uniref:Uncharacterized protein n=1 Tax=Pleurodeles waltl TaxID=8319 RepID=A0AAV7SQD1_PLEWA|nr:hypothetical protein NDU88_006746 [Pleurodeles waltl]
MQLRPRVMNMVRSARGQKENYRGVFPLLLLKWRCRVPCTVRRGTPGTCVAQGKEQTLLSLTASVHQRHTWDVRSTGYGTDPALTRCTSAPEALVART